MKSDEAIIEELHRDLQQRRERESLEVSVPIRPKPVVPPGAAFRLPRESEEDREKRERKNRVDEFMRNLIESRGLRYAACTLRNFDTPLDEQAGAIQKLTAYCDEIARHAAEGRGVFLYGPCGTGKDHLAMAVTKCFIKATAKRVEWTSGAMLFEELRDSFDGRKSEGEVLRRYVQAPLLWISDPLPVRGELTPYQSEALYRLVDARYNAKRPILVTANMAAGEADKLLGPAIARRLRDSTIQIPCNWKQYRGS